MEFEDVLEELGGFGKFQKMLLWFFLLPSQFLLPFFSMNLIFLLSEPDHQCVVPELDALGLNASRVEHFRKLVVSEDECSMFPLLPFNTTVPFGENASDSATWNISGMVNQSAAKQPCEQFRYDDLYYDETVPTKWDLVCDHGHLPSLVYTVGTVGGIVGTLIFGAMADRCGRKRTFYVIVVLAVFSGFGAALSTSFIVFVAMRSIKTLLDTQMEQLPYVLLMELVGAEQRTLMLGVTCVSWTLGMCLLPLVAYLSRTWVMLLTVCTCCSLPLFFYWKILPESPRWLLSQNRLAEAEAILRRVATWNGVQPPADLDQKLRKAQHNVKAEDEAESSGSMLDLFTKPKIRTRLLILTVIWSGNSSVYGAMHINATHLSGNEFLNFFYLALVEIPATAIGWWSMDRFGRRWTNVFFMLLTATSCWAPVIAPTTGMVSLVASIVAKFSTTAAYMMMYQQSDELFPTPVRSFSVGVITALAGAFTAVMPYLIYLGKYGAWIPFLFLAILLTTAGIAASFLPETRGYPLCQTVEDAEKFGNDQKFFSFNRAEELRKRSKGVDQKDQNGVEMRPLQAEA